MPGISGEINISFKDLSVLPTSDADLKNFVITNLSDVMVRQLQNLKSATQQAAVRDVDLSGLRGFGGECSCGIRF